MLGVMLYAPLCAAFVIAKQPVHVLFAVMVFAPQCVAFVMVEDHLCVPHDNTLDAEVAFDHDKSGEYLYEYGLLRNDLDDGLPCVK